MNTSRLIDPSKAPPQETIFIDFSGMAIPDINGGQRAHPMPQLNNTTSIQTTAAKVPQLLHVVPTKQPASQLEKREISKKIDKSDFDVIKEMYSTLNKEISELVFRYIENIIKNNNELDFTSICNITNLFVNLLENEFHQTILSKQKSLEILLSIKNDSLQLAWQFVTLFIDIKDLKTEDLGKLIKGFHEIREKERKPLIDFLNNFPQKESRRLFMKCIYGLTEEDKSNFYGLADLFSEKNFQLKTVKRLFLIPSEKRFSAGMIIKKNIEYGGDKESLKLFFNKVQPVSNENITNLIERAEKLFRKDSTLEDKIGIIGKMSLMKDPQAQEDFVALTKKLIVNEKTGENDFKVIDFLEKIPEGERCSAVELAHQFFDQNISSELKLIVLENILKIAPSERKNVCQCVTQIFPNNTTLNEILAGIQCFKEIKPEQRNDFAETIKGHFRNTELSLLQKIQIVKQIEAEQMVNNFLN